MPTARNLGFDAVAEQDANETEHRRRIARTVNRLNQGKMNCTFEATLAAGTPTTVLADPRLAATSFVALMPRTASAAAALAGGIVVEERRSGSAVLRHAVSSASDRDFTVLVLG